MQFWPLSALQIRRDNARHNCQILARELAATSPPIFAELVKMLQAAKQITDKPLKDSAIFIKWDHPLVQVYDPLKPHQLGFLLFPQGLSLDATHIPIFIHECAMLEKSLWSLIMLTATPAKLTWPEISLELILNRDYQEGRFLIRLATCRSLQIYHRWFGMHSASSEAKMLQL